MGFINRKYFVSSILAAAIVVASGPISRAAVLAKIGDQAISTEQVKSEFGQATSMQRKVLNEDELARRNIVDNVVNTEILWKAAKQSGLDRDAEYQAALERFQKQYLAAKFVQRATEPKLVRSEYKKFFDENKNFFDSTQVCSSHILVKEEAEARRVLEMAKANKNQFGALAKKYSIDPTAQDADGQLGCMPKERLVPEYAATAFKMKKNEIQGPVRSAYGYHIIYVTDIKAGKTPTFDEVEERVKDTYRMRLISDVIGDLRQKSKVSVNSDEVKKLRL